MLNLLKGPPRTLLEPLSTNQVKKNNDLKPFLTDPRDPFVKDPREPILRLYWTEWCLVCWNTWCLRPHLGGAPGEGFAESRRACRALHQGVVASATLFQQTKCHFGKDRNRISYHSQREGQDQGPWGGHFLAILRKSSKMTILRISGLSVLYHMINMTILEWNNRIFGTWQNRYFQRP